MKLPFETSPYIMAYHNKAFPLGVIQGNADFDLRPWISGKFINCYFRLNSPKFDLYTLDPWGEGAGVNLSQSIRLTREMFDQLSLDILQVVKTLLDNSCYVHGSWNEKYIPVERVYGQSDRMHDYMLIGYDEEERIFYSVGYTKRGRYEEFTVTFEEYLDSLRNSQNRCIDINTCQFCLDGNFSFNKDNCIVELTDYLNSTTSWGEKPGRIYGINGVRALKQYIEETKEGIDIRFTRLLMEYKALMQLRIEYLCPDLGDAYRPISRAAEQIYMLSIKYAMTGKKELMANILNNFDTVLQLEPAVLPQFLEAVKMI